MKFLTKSAALCRSLAFVFLLLLAANIGLGKGDAVNYLAPGQPDAIALLAPPPLADSAEQTADLNEVRAVHQAASPEDVAAATAEHKFNIFNFTPVIGDFFQPGKFPKTEAFFHKVQKDAEAVVNQSKDYYKRPRPYVIDPSLANGKLETSFSYPSGHSTESMVLALVLAEVFPDKSDALIAHARQIGWHRVQIARHYPTDIYAGRVLAKAIVRELDKNPDFQKELAEVKAEIAAGNK